MADRWWIVGATLLTALLFSGCHTARWADADVLFAGEFDPQGGDLVTHKYRFVLPDGKEGWKMCSELDLPARTWYGFEDLHRSQPAHDMEGSPGCGSEVSELDPGDYVFFIEAPGKGSYRVALYFQ